MSQQEEMLSRRSSRSLSIRVSLWLIAAAIIPLLITVGVSEWYARPTLTDQSRTAMETDAKTHSQLINNYFSDRVVDVESLAQAPLAQNIMIDPVKDSVNIPFAIQNGKIVAGQLDPHFSLWAIFSLQGKPLFSFSSDNGNGQLQPHGQFIIPPEEVQKILQGKSFVSAVYYDPATKKASVDIYTPSYSLTLQRPVGFVRATLALDYIWSIVDSESGANGNGSYAFMLDENGVRIADPVASRRFTAIAALDPQVQQAISSEARYGNNSATRVLADDALNNQLHKQNTATTFEIQPTGQQETFQVTRQRLSVVPWNYIVLSPVNTVIQVANQQLIITILIALLVLIPVTLIGIAVGRRLSFPILRSVENLRSSSDALVALASKQKSAAAEQMWVVDSSQIGLKSVQYYNEATGVAADYMSDVGRGLLHRWETVDEHEAKQAIAKIVDAAQYIKKATHYQNTSNEKLSTAINVTTQVSEQLASGATSATEASNQLKQVVGDLRQIVGQ